MTSVSKQNKQLLSQSGVKTALAAGAVGVGAGALTTGLVLNSYQEYSVNSYQEYRCQLVPGVKVSTLSRSTGSNS